MTLNPEIWGPHYWFFLHTIALTYPSYPNAITKKKYYNFIQDLPLFIPDAKIAKEFSHLLDKYPVTPYLDSRPSFNKWMHFIHNKINFVLNKPQMNILDSTNKYKENYKMPDLVQFESKKWKQKLVYVSIIVVLLIIAINLIKV
jgi:hypothetical protein